VVRAGWLSQTIGVIQRAVDAIELEDRLDRPTLASRLVESLPPAAGAYERILLRSILVGLGLRLIDMSHADLRGHPCDCALRCGCDLWRYSSACQNGDPIAEFGEWLANFLTTIRTAHPRAAEERAAWILRSSFRRHIAPARLAYDCGCSLSLLRAKFSRRYGMSFRQYVHLARVVTACRELRNGTPKIEALARECGYSSKKEFYRVFRTATGCVPQAFRQLPGNEADCCLTALAVRLIGGSRASLGSANLAIARATLERSRPPVPQSA